MQILKFKYVQLISILLALNSLSGFSCLPSKIQTASVFSVSNGEEDTVAIKYSKTITKEDLSRHLHILASDEYEGRETGMEGQKKAAKYISEHYAKIGIPPLPSAVETDSNYYQEFPLILQSPYGTEISVNNIKYEFLKDFYYFSGFNDTNIVRNNVVFLGYGISDKNYDDYKNVDVSGKIVLIFNGEPYNKDSISYITKSRSSSGWSKSWRKKVQTAKEKNVLALMVIVDDFESKLNKVRHWVEKSSMKLEGKSSSKRIPNFYISTEMANAMFSSANIKGDAISMKKKIDKKGKPISFNLMTDIVIDVSRKSEKISSENVLGYIEGSDLKDELLVMTAHYDHIGMDGEKIYNGADDDGSGTVAIMELAEAFAKAKKGGHGPRRSMLFMTLSGEEKGLLGSKYYTDNPVFALENTIADLNIDMIGRLDSMHRDNPNYIYLIGSDRLSTDLHNISEEANKLYTNLELDYTFNIPNDPNRFYYRSDHYNFAKNNIPVIFYFNGVHEDYHRPTDTVDKINFDKIEKITRLVFFTAWELVNRDERITVDFMEEPDE